MWVLRNPPRVIEVTLHLPSAYLITAISLNNDGSRWLKRYIRTSWHSKEIEIHTDLVSMCLTFSHWGSFHVECAVINVTIVRVQDFNDVAELFLIVNMHGLQPVWNNCSWDLRNGWVIALIEQAMDCMVSRSGLGELVCLCS